MVQAGNVGGPLSALLASGALGFTLHNEDSDSDEPERDERMTQFGTEPYALEDQLDMFVAVGDLPPKRKLSFSGVDSDDEDMRGDPQYADWSMDSKIFAVTSERNIVTWWDTETRTKMGEVRTKVTC